MSPTLHRALPLLALAALSGPSSAAPQDWPQWRGPRGDNVSLETGWSSVGREAPLWRAEVGRGYSSPSIAGGRLIITGYFEDPATPHEGSDRLSCLEAETGAELWSLTYPARAYDNEHAGGTLATATIADGLAYVPTRAGQVRALAMLDGSLAWEVDLVERHQVSPGRYGFASSPYVLGERIVLNAARAIALDRATGETLWISDDYDANYSTVAPVTLGERECLAVFGGKGLVLIDAATGEHVQTFEFRKTPRNVEGATPIVMGERVFASSGYDQGGVLVDFSGPAPELLWRTRRMRTKMAGCTLHEGFLYGFDESMLECLDLEGELRWRERGLGHGALSIAGGRLLVTSSDGELIVAEATPEGYREQSRRPVVEGGVFWTAPVLAGGRIYFRGSLGDLVCLDHRGDGRPVAAPGGTAAAGDLPAPEELVRRHLERMGLRDSKVTALRMTGRLHVEARGLEDVEALWELGPGGRWHARFGLPPAMPGSIEVFFDGRQGWETSPFRGNVFLPNHQLGELLRSKGLRTIFEPLASGPTGGSAGTVGREDFRGTPCLRVDLEATQGVGRSLYFDERSGLLAGRSGAEESTVVFGDWRPVEGLLLPFARTTFDPETGEEERWRFERAVFEGPADELFAMPQDLIDAQKSEDR